MRSKGKMCEELANGGVFLRVSFSEPPNYTINPNDPSTVQKNGANVPIDQ